MLPTWPRIFCPWSSVCRYAPSALLGIEYCCGKCGCQRSSVGNSASALQAHIPCADCIMHKCYVIWEFPDLGSGGMSNIMKTIILRMTDHDNLSFVLQSASEEGRSVESATATPSKGPTGEERSEPARQPQTDSAATNGHAAPGNGSSAAPESPAPSKPDEEVIAWRTDGLIN